MVKETVLKQVREDLRTLLAYNWADEEADYANQDDNSRENHIFIVMMRLDRWSKGAYADGYQDATDNIACD